MSLNVEVKGQQGQKRKKLLRHPDIDNAL